MPTDAQDRPVSVEIYDGVYQLRGVDPQHIARLAAMVDGKMRAVSAHGATVDSLRVAVLAALNIADELAELRQRHRSLVESLDTRGEPAHAAAPPRCRICWTTHSLRSFRDRIAV